MQANNSSETLQGTVVRSAGGLYEVDIPTVEERLICQARGIFKKGKRKVSQAVVVGDYVRVEPLQGDGADAQGRRLREGNIIEVLPRHSTLSRARHGKMQQITVANLDLLIVTMSLRRPDINTHRLDRFLVLAEANHLEAIVCFNKIDLINDEELKHEIEPIQSLYTSLGYRCIYTSAETDQGIEELQGLMSNKISAFVGSSGVGKSSLACAAQPGLGLWIGEVMDIGKGRHTTTDVTLHSLDGGGYLVDTPGVKTILLLEDHEEYLDECFPEFRPLLGQCKFNNCTHTKEPGCAVRGALDSGIITPARYESYARILAEFQERPVRYGE